MSISWLFHFKKKLKTIVFFQGLTDFLLKGTQFTLFCAKHMMDGTSFSEAFK
jgi:hypothetical protein